MKFFSSPWRFSCQREVAGHGAGGKTGAKVESGVSGNFKN